MRATAARHQSLCRLWRVLFSRHHSGVALLEVAREHQSQVSMAVGRVLPVGMSILRLARFAIAVRHQRATPSIQVHMSLSQSMCISQPLFKHRQRVAKEEVVLSTVLMVLGHALAAKMLTLQCGQLATVAKHQSHLKALRLVGKEVLWLVLMAIGNALSVAT